MTLATGFDQKLELLGKLLEILYSKEYLNLGVLSRDLTGFVVGIPTVWRIVVVVGDQ